MSSIAEIAYEPARPWSNRSFSMPAVPGGNSGQIKVLRCLLYSLRSGVHVDEPLQIADGGGATVTFSSMGQRLQPAGLVTRTGKNSWLLTRQAEAWLDSEDDGYLLSILHANVRFVGELLHEARDGMTQSDLLCLASNKYGCSWDSLDQIRRRTAWLRAGGFLDLDFRHQVTPTSTGLKLLDKLELAQPGATRKRDSVSVAVIAPPPTGLVQSALASIDTKQRKAKIGYIPRSEGNALYSLRKFSIALKDGITREEIDRFASAEFGLRPSSTASALSAFKSAGLVEQVGFNEYKSTELAVSCTEGESNIDFLRALHTRFRFFGEVLEALEEVDTPRDLAVIGKLRYGMPREDIAEVRTRLQMMRECGLIEEVSWGHYRLLDLGRALLAELPCEMLNDESVELESLTSDEGGTQGSGAPGYEEICAELHAASRASTAPERFEAAVAQAFDYLGFDAQLLGGSGQTDVLVAANLAGDKRFTVIIDAKSSASGKVGEQQINFDTIKEHKAANSADFALAVGPSFPGQRLIARAEAHGIGLFGVEEFVKLLKMHSEAPFTLTELMDLLKISGTVTSAIVERKWAVEIRAFRLCERVLHQLATEAANVDAFTTGALSAHDLYLILRTESADPPSPPEIESVLSLLSSDLVHAVQKSGSQYFILEDPQTTARRLHRLAASIISGGSR
ncbi:restriction endonuclease [Streptomyces sp. NBC_01693]|uniref:restriction endonuclease n=1 Tax=unclassified Streptomyces TaxID=2593676 RepID=UPI002E30E24C|nr:MULTISPECIES: restriction endonuclease [unclassified Streptomyces]